MNTAVLIIDLDKLTPEQWRNLFTTAGVSAHRISDRSIQTITDHIELVQLKELNIKNKEEENSNDWR